MQHVLRPEQPQPRSGRVHPGLRVPLPSGDDDDDDRDDDDGYIHSHQVNWSTAAIGTENI